MKDLPSGLAAHLASGVTTLCWCWRVTRRDGVAQGFTDHDRALTFDGTTFEAATGFTASDIKDDVGLSIDNLEVTGALSSASLNDADLAAGRYDDARVEIFRVNWQAPEQRVLMRAGSLGEVKRSGSAFTAEVRGLAHYLQQPKGRLLQLTCDADLGDARCGVDLGESTFRGEGAIVSVYSDRRFAASGLGAYAHDFFTRGLLTFTSGASAGLKIEVKTHANSGGAVVLELWADAEGSLGIGDSFTVSAGCNKRFETCKSRFANGTNFRGFPAIPGNAYLTKIAHRG
jgi:uncharacterized phage protein (TIGR02218 family)